MEFEEVAPGKPEAFANLIYGKPFTPLFWSGLYNEKTGHYLIKAFLNVELGNKILENKKPDFLATLKELENIINSITCSNEPFIDQKLEHFADLVDSLMLQTRGLLATWESHAGTTPEALRKRQAQLLKQMKKGEIYIEEKFMYIRAEKEGLL